ncbi:MAG: RNA 2',3'-cyclic phosphodiesterase [Chloroflexi bacterium]|nr:RNA 2',3'-cyclic phosphodiesterase [Chloroflexota bacterium]
MNTIRAFIAIELPENIKRYLTGLQAEIGQGNERYVKWVETQNIHLTLKFLGNISEATVPALSKAITEAVKDIPAFTLITGEPGSFPDNRNPRIIWTGLGGAVDTLVRLQKSIELNTQPLGFPADSKGFSPHLTLGRLRDNATFEQRQSTGKALSSINGKEKLPFTVNSVLLVKSTLTQQGPVYNHLAAINLADSLPK